MLLYIKIKQASKRKWVLDRTPIEVPLKAANIALRTIITKIVEQQVAAYNNKEIKRPCIDFLAEDQIIDSATTGKVGFGTIYNKEKADVKKAVKVALQAFEDGLYAVAIDKKVIDKLDIKIELSEGTEIIFIKLTLLKG